MDDEEKKRVMELYDCDDDITSYIIHSGTRIGSTTKARLDKGLVDELEDDD